MGVLSSIHNNLTRHAVAVVEEHLDNVMSGGEMRDVDAGLLGRVGIGDEHELAAEVIHLDAFHALAGNVEGGLRGIREEGEFGCHRELFDTVVESDEQGEMDDRVTTGDRVVLDVVVVGAAVGRRDDEVVVLILVTVHGGVGDENFIGRVDREVKDIDGVTSGGSGEAVIVGAFGDECAIVPSKRYVFASFSVGFEEVSGQNVEDEVDSGVAAVSVGEDNVVVEGAGLCGKGVEAVELVGLALTDRVVNIHYIRHVDGEVEFEDIKTSCSVLQRVGVVACSGDALSAPCVREFTLADSVCGDDVRGGVNREDEREGAVAAVNSGHRVCIDAALGEGLAMPQVRQVVVTDGDLLLSVGGRVNNQR